MAATISRGYTFGTTELVTNSKLHTLIESAAIASIDTTNIASDAGIVDTQLAQLTTSDKVSGSAITDLLFWENNLVSYENNHVWIT